jgi:hypothetical protein
MEQKTRLSSLDNRECWENPNIALFLCSPHFALNKSPSAVRVSGKRFIQAKCRSNGEIRKCRSTERIDSFPKFSRLYAKSAPED